MARLLKEIKYDLNYIRGHTNQPGWYKVLKVFILAGVFAGFLYLFGIRRTVIFFIIFFILMGMVHLLYRVKTDRFTQSWLDFIVAEEDGQVRGKSIGIYYYASIVLSAVIAFLLSNILE